MHAISMFPVRLLPSMLPSSQLAIPIFHFQTKLEYRCLFTQAFITPRVYGFTEEHLLMIAGLHPSVQSLLGTLFTWGLTAAGAGLVFIWSGGKVNWQRGQCHFGSLYTC